MSLSDSEYQDVDMDRSRHRSDLVLPCSPLFPRLHRRILQDSTTEPSTMPADFSRGVIAWVRFACERNGVPELAQAIQIEWNRRFTRRMGDALYNPFTFRARIRLSNSPLWARASDQERFETVVHEASHVIAWYTFGLSIKAHGPEWRQAMRNCGVEPVRTHSVDRTGLVRRQRRSVLLDCPGQGIDHKCRITARKFNLVQRGAVLYCKKCGIDINRESPIEKDREVAVQKL